jgi:hypothetical protein
MSLFDEVDLEIKEIKKDKKQKINDLIKRTKPYRPTSGDEGVYFEKNLCATCKKYKTCNVLVKLSGDFTKEVRKIDNDIFCINHTDFKIENWEKK